MPEDRRRPTRGSGAHKGKRRRPRTGRRNLSTSMVPMVASHGRPLQQEAWPAHQSRPPRPHLAAQRKRRPGHRAVLPMLRAPSSAEASSPLPPPPPTNRQPWHPAADPCRAWHTARLWIPSPGSLRAHRRWPSRAPHATRGVTRCRQRREGRYRGGSPPRPPRPWNSAAVPRPAGPSVWSPTSQPHPRRRRPAACRRPGPRRRVPAAALPACFDPGTRRLRMRRRPRLPSSRSGLSGQGAHRWSSAPACR